MYPVYLLLIVSLGSSNVAGSGNMTFSYFKDQDSCKTAAVAVESRGSDWRAFCVMSGSLKP